MLQLGDAEELLTFFTLAVCTPADCAPQAFGLEYPDASESELLEKLKTRFADILKSDMQKTMQQQLDKKQLVCSVMCLKVIALSRPAEHLQVRGKHLPVDMKHSLFHSYTIKFV